MTHYDEGTIHAWLDGALDATQAQALEAHIASCSACSAAVAEARGLVAASSRILTSLDDVPANVVPKKAKPPKRQWRAAPWVTGIAATLILAVGVTTWNRSGVKDMSPVASTRAEATAKGSGDSAPPMAAPPVVSTQPTAAPAAPAAGVGVTTSDARLQRGIAADRPSAPLRAKRMAESPTASVGSVQGNTIGRASAGAGVAQAPAPPAMDQVASKAAPSPEKTQVAEAAPAEAMRRAARLAPSPIAATTLSDVAPDLSGCYRRPMPALREDASTLSRVAERATEAAKSRVSRAAPAAAATVAPTAVSPYAAWRSGEFIRLDTIGRQLGIVRSAMSDSIGFWKYVNADTVEVDLRPVGIFRMAAKDRVRCPQ